MLASGPGHNPAGVPHLVVDQCDPFERGRRIGAATQDMIRTSITVYERLFGDALGMDWAEASRFAARYWAPIRAFEPSMASEIEGIAHGADLALNDVLTLNCRTELLFGVGGEDTGGSECTAFYVASTASANGHALLGQNWDWRPVCRPLRLLIEIYQPDGPALLTFTEAGVVGKFGFNEAGVGVAVNALRSRLDQGDAGVPFHVLARAALSAASAEGAGARIVGATRASSGNYLVGSRAGQSADFETGPGGIDRVFIQHPVEGLLFHCNHFVADIPFMDIAPVSAPGSYARYDSILEMLSVHPGGVREPEIAAALQSHSEVSESICRHVRPELDALGQTTTLFSWIIDLEDSSALVADGPPCESTYRRVRPFNAKAVGGEIPNGAAWV